MPATSPFGRTVLVMGPEGLLAEREVERLTAAARAEQPELQVNDVMAATLDPGALAEMTGASLFAATTLAIVRDLASLPPELTDLVAGLARDTPEDVALVLVHGGGVKGKGLVDKIKKAKCEVVDCPSLKTWELPQFVAGEARRVGAQVDAPAAQALVAAVGADLRALAGAVAQLHADAEGRPITRELVARYFGGRAEVTSFAVADDTLAGERGAALEKLRWALATGVAPVLVTSAFAGSLRALGKYLDQRGSGLRDPQLAAAVGVPPWKLRDLGRQARRWDDDRVAAGLALVARADADIKGAAGSPDFTLERLVLDLTAL